MAQDRLKEGLAGYLHTGFCLRWGNLGFVFLLTLVFFCFVCCLLWVMCVWLGLGFLSFFIGEGGEVCVDSFLTIDGLID